MKLFLVHTLSIMVMAASSASPAAEPDDVLRATKSPVSPVVGANVNVMGDQDAVETVEGASCNPGKQTAQQELTIAVNPEDPNNLVAGANDYRLYSSTQQRYDASGGVYRSTDGGATWSVGLLPGLVRMNQAAPGPYEAAGDPAIAAGPDNTFWYANIAFYRNHSRSSVAVSRSTDGGATWITKYVIQSQGGAVFHDKEWIAADPRDPNVAYVTWSRFHTGALLAEIVISKTVDGGNTWSVPSVISLAPINQGSVPYVDDLGFVHVVYASGTAVLTHAVSPDGGKAFVTQALGPITPTTMSGLSFRHHNFAAGFSGSGSNLHIVHGSTNGSSNDVLYHRSPDYGVTWLPPMLISRIEGDQFFPWVGAHGDKVFATWNQRIGKGEIITYQGAASADGGLTWSDQFAVSSAASNMALSNEFKPGCTHFIGDYTGVAVGSDGVAHALWADARAGNSPGSPGNTVDLDPYTATLRFE